jgi:hypothetical protein
MKLPHGFGTGSVDKKLWLSCRDCLNDVEQAFQIDEIHEPGIGNFLIITSKQKPDCYFAWKVSLSLHSFELCLIQYETVYYTASNYGGHEHTDSHIYFFGHLDLKNDFGVGLMQPETIADKVSELFNPIEIDFETHPKFSSRYYVLAEDREHFSNAIPADLLDYLQDIKGLQIEFRNRKCLFRLPKAVDRNECLELCNIGLTLDRILNK